MVLYLKVMLQIANELTLLAGTVSADRTVTLPDATGTVALTSDIPTNNNQLTNGALDILIHLI